MAKVSLVVPIYNSSMYLNKCIDSLVNQTLKDIEIILINDGSTDKSEKVIKEYKDKRIKYISKKNAGIGKTRNRGIKEATGEYIAFVDSDDYLNEHFCEYMYKKAHADNCDLVICNFFEDRGNLYGIKFKDFKDTSLKDNPSLINNINLGPCNKLYSLKLLKNNDIYFEENLKYEDAPFVVKAFLYFLSSSSFIIISQILNISNILPSIITEVSNILGHIFSLCLFFLSLMPFFFIEVSKFNISSFLLINIFIPTKAPIKSIKINNIGPITKWILDIGTPIRVANTSPTKSPNVPKRNSVTVSFWIFLSNPSIIAIIPL